MKIVKWRIENEENEKHQMAAKNIGREWRKMKNDENIERKENEKA
jgi:hypothetical protein